MAGTSRTRPRNRRVETCGATFVAAALCLSVWMFDHGTDARTPPQPPAAAGFPHGASSGPAPHGTPRADRPEAGPRPGPDQKNRGNDEEADAAQRKASDPLRVRIPSLGLETALTRLGLAPSGALEAPPLQDADVAGWYAAGTPPGAVGTAVVAGHVDTADGPAVFYRLGAVEKGAEVEVDRRDGFTAVFTVDAVEVYEGSGFPSEKVYGHAPRPELRLITCGGTFDEEADEYTGNVVVFAHLTGVRRTDRPGGPSSAEPAGSGG